MAEMKREPTPETIGDRIAQALAEAPGDRKIEWLCDQAQVSTATMYRFIGGQSVPSVLEVWRIAAATGKPYSWFAGVGQAAPAESFLAAADAMDAQIVSLAQQLERMQSELSRLRRLAVADARRRTAVDPTADEAQRRAEISAKASGGRRTREAG